MKIADGIEMLELPMNLMGRGSKIYPTLIWDDDTVVLVDAGAPDSLPEIKNAMEKAGVPLERINEIVITHQDIDHIGGVKNILHEISGVKVLAHGEDIPYIQGEKQLVRLKTGFKDRIKALPEEEQDKILGMFENSSVEVDMALSDGEELGCCGGVIVIYTPGHTPGHICLYHKKSKTLIAGDAMNVIDGQLIEPNKQIMGEEEFIEAINSLRKLEEYDIQNVISYHGGLFNYKPNQRIKDIIQGLI